MIPLSSAVGRVVTSSINIRSFSPADLRPIVRGTFRREIERLEVGFDVGGSSVTPS